MIRNLWFCDSSPAPHPQCTPNPTLFFFLSQQAAFKVLHSWAQQMFGNTSQLYVSEMALQNLPAGIKKHNNTQNVTWNTIIRTRLCFPNPYKRQHFFPIVNKHPKKVFLRFLLIYWTTDEKKTTSISNSHKALCSFNASWKYSHILYGPLACTHVDQGSP